MNGKWTRYLAQVQIPDFAPLQSVSLRGAQEFVFSHFPGSSDAQNIHIEGRPFVTPVANPAFSHQHAFDHTAPSSWSVLHPSLPGSRPSKMEEKGLKWEK